MDRAADGWARLLLVAIRQDPEGRAAVAAALLDEETLARALEAAGIGPVSAAERRHLASDLLAALAGPQRT